MPLTLMQTLHHVQNLEVICEHVYAAAHSCDVSITVP